MSFYLPILAFYFSTVAMGVPSASPDLSKLQLLYFRPEKALKTANAAFEVCKLRDLELSLAKGVSFSDEKLPKTKLSCVVAQFKKARQAVPLFIAPSSQSQKVGDLVSRIEAKKGWIYEFVDTDSRIQVFKPDFEGERQHDEDQPDFHTALEKQGDWVRLPKGPFLTPVWANAKENGLVTDGLLNLGEIVVKTKKFKGSFMIEKRDGAAFVGYAKTPANAHCGSMEQSEADAIIKAAPRFRLPLEDLVDQNLHLKIAQGDRKGC